MSVKGIRRVGGRRGARRKLTGYYATARPADSQTEKIRKLMRDYSSQGVSLTVGRGSTGMRDNESSSASGLPIQTQFYTSSDGTSGVASGDVPDNSRTEFELDYEPLNESVAIYINGRHRPEVDYSVAGAVITFTTPPRSDMFISGIYLR